MPVGDAEAVVLVDDDEPVEPEPLPPVTPEGASKGSSSEGMPTSMPPLTLPPAFVDPKSLTVHQREQVLLRMQALQYLFCIQ